MGILVSIDCITYNHEKYISDAIESFLMQETNFEFEILIHDDASTDRTVSIINEYQRKYPNIIIPILQKENQYSKGVKRISYNYNYRRSRGKYIAICEGDDYWTDKYKLQKQVDYMEKHPNCSLCFHTAEVVGVDREKLDVIRPYNKNCISSTEDIIFGGGKFMATNSILYRKSAMDNPPNFYFDCSVGDYPLQVITSLQDYAYYIDEIMSAYRMGVDGSWTKKLLMSEDAIEKMINERKTSQTLFDNINQYTNFKYDKIIKRYKCKSKFRILVMKIFPKTYLKLVKLKNKV